MEFVNSSRAELIKTNASDIDVARAAWVSNYGEDAREKDAGKITGLINFLYRQKHMSPFEHGSFTFFIDVPLFVAREFHRHRTMSYNEVSGRYSELKPRFYVPPRERPLIQEGKIGAYNFVPGSDEQYVRMKRALENNAERAWSYYKELLAQGVAREVARDVLPLNLMTQFYATVNPRSLMQFLALRDDAQALYEIRDVARQMDIVFKDTMPITHSAYRAGREDSRVAELEAEIIAKDKAYQKLSSKYSEYERYDGLA